MAMTTAANRLWLERLEDRTAPATLIWTGAVDDQWGTSNTFGNTNWAFNLLPHNGDSLIFPASSQHHANTNNLSGLSLNNITIQYRPFTIQGNTITLSGNFLDSSSDPTGIGLWTIPLRLSGGSSHTFSSNSSAANDIIQAAITVTNGFAGLTKDGPGRLELAGPGNSYAGTTTVSAGLLELSAGHNLAITEDVTINGGVVRDLVDNALFGELTSTVTVNAGGTFDLNGHSDVVGALSVLAGGTFNTAGSGQGHLTIFTNNPNGLSLASGSTVSMKIGDSASNTDLISAHS